ncbi:MAG: MFS transporter [Firmicutes bacterium]|nr:MFS transporter [Bacillota bacterium]
MDKEYKQYFWLVFSISFAAFMGKLDFYIVNISLPSIAKDYNVDVSQVSQVVLYFMLFLTSTMMIFGKIADKTDLKKLFIWGYAVFTIGSALCGLSTNIFMLVGSRCIQGIGGAMLSISTIALIPRILPKEVMGWAFGIVSTAAALGVSAGAPLGGIITAYFSWHWVFLINIPIGILAIITARRVLPNCPGFGRDKSRKFDYTGAVTSFLSIFLLLFALNKGKEMGWTSLPITGCFAAAVIILAVFVIVELKSSHPLLNFRIFRDKGFLYAVIAGSCAFLIMSGNNFLMPFYLELVKQLTPDKVGFVLMCFSVVYIMVGPRAGKLADKIDPRILCLSAMFSGMAAVLFFAATLHLGGLTYVIIFLVWMGISYGCFISPNNKLVMEQAPADMQGEASGVFNMLTTLFQAFGICIFETIFSEHLPVTSKSLHHSNFPSWQILTGFQTDYAIAAGIFLFAAILTIITLQIRPIKRDKVEVIPEI